MIFRVGDVVAVKDLRHVKCPTELIQKTWEYYKKVTKGKFGVVKRYNHTIVILISL